jgi:hypothetical protein
MNLNDIVGVALLILGGLMVIIALAAFVKVQFFTAGTKSFNETLKQINELLKSWEKILLLIPPPMRHIFVLLPLGLVVGAAGLWILTKKPI